MDWVIVFIVVLVLILIIGFAYNLVQKYLFNKRLNEQIQNYNSIPLGMKKQEALNLLGNDFSYSMLKDGVEKYEWKVVMQNSMYGNDFKKHKSKYTVNMTLKFKNGVVIEKKGNNLDLGNSADDATKYYNSVNLGMDKSEVIKLFGNNYTISLLKNGNEKYEWKIRDVGNTGKVTLIFKDNKVIEKLSNNI